MIEVVLDPSAFYQHGSRINPDAHRGQILTTGMVAEPNSFPPFTVAMGMSF